MEQTYDIFEKFPDGSAIWRGLATGLDCARGTLEELSRRSSNEFFLFHGPTRQIVARANARE